MKYTYNCEKCQTSTELERKPRVKVDRELIEEYEVEQTRIKYERSESEKEYQEELIAYNKQLEINKMLEGKYYKEWLSYESSMRTLLGFRQSYLGFAGYLKHLKNESRYVSYPRHPAINRRPLVRFGLSEPKHHYTVECPVCGERNYF